MAWNLGLLGASSSVAAGNFELLETAFVSSDTSSITFSNLNSTYGSTYQHLQIRATSRNNANDTAIWIGIQFNSDTNNNYSRMYIRGTGSTTEASWASGSDYIWLGESVSSQITSNIFSGTVAEILDPFETTKNTIVRSISGQQGTRNMVWFMSGMWNNTAALTSIRIYLPQGGSYVSGSRFSLYGIRGTNA